ncbi:thioesterase family protein [Paenibacillus sp. GYB004]|jgi:acyl-CoA thioester hydrolase|uniref:acyl-CoA thioesterase n=1 Tax=unclassified Paenibacillus TaxID=185978 RepID=UPI002F96DC16
MTQKQQQQEPGRWHGYEIRVRYGETDRMGVVYHPNYATWFEVGRTELIRERGLPYSRIEELGLYLPVIELESKFRLPAKYDDRIAIYTRIRSYNHLTVHFESQIRRLEEGGAVSSDGEQEAAERNGSPAPAGELLVTGATRHVWLGRDWKPVRIDREAPELYRLLGEE